MYITSEGHNFMEKDERRKITKFKDASSLNRPTSNKALGTLTTSLVNAKAETAAWVLGLPPCHSSASLFNDNSTDDCRISVNPEYEMAWKQDEDDDFLYFEEHVAASEQKSLHKLGRPIPVYGRGLKEKPKVVDAIKNMPHCFIKSEVQLEVPTLTRSALYKEGYFIERDSRRETTFEPFTNEAIEETFGHPKVSFYEDTEKPVGGIGRGHFFNKVLSTTPFQNTDHIGSKMIPIGQGGQRSEKQWKPMDLNHIRSPPKNTTMNFPPLS